ncbi:hypothetical protein BC936DRAFT_136883 [Jimgerdemannia flammicorona]|uniref:Uncharacterized protein n=1 Tax=Jimgerdemannia flammicorona TaxID=994334 RepID=A0A433CYK2_9FUNG|nr:hypothetical protein BC936DRAFT_136883 [Jimgerdemannia flammicorona]
MSSIALLPASSYPQSRPERARRALGVQFSGLYKEDGSPITPRQQQQVAEAIGDAPGQSPEEAVVTEVPVGWVDGNLSQLGLSLLNRKLALRASPFDFRIFSTPPNPSTQPPMATRSKRTASARFTPLATSTTATNATGTQLTVLDHGDRDHHAVKDLFHETWGENDLKDVKVIEIVKLEYPEAMLQRYNEFRSRAEQNEVERAWAGKIFRCGLMEEISDGETKHLRPCKRSECGVCKFARRGFRMACDMSPTTKSSEAHICTNERGMLRAMFLCNCVVRRVRNNYVVVEDDAVSAKDLQSAIVRRRLHLEHALTFHRYFQNTQFLQT